MRVLVGGLAVSHAGKGASGIVGAKSKIEGKEREIEIWYQIEKIACNCGVSIHNKYSYLWWSRDTIIRNKMYT